MEWIQKVDFLHAPIIKIKQKCNISNLISQGKIKRESLIVKTNGNSLMQKGRMQLVQGCAILFLRLVVTWNFNDTSRISEQLSEFS